jgi:hypothetical protein
MGYASLQDFKQEREKIEQRIDMHALVGEYVRLNRKGKGACPFHQDDKPSFQVYPDGHAYCFGCRWSGYAIKFLMAIRQIDFKTALAIAKEKSGHWGNPRANAVDLRPNTIRHFQGRETTPDPNQINWQNQAWQAWSEAQVTAAGERMTGLVMARFQKERGLDGATVKRFEVGWTGDKSITNIKVGDRSLFIRSHSWIFPVRNEAGQIQMLKWRHTLPEHIKKYGKYGQLAGGQGTLFNLKAAKSREEIVLCTGEFETMVLWQEAGIEAACHTAGEAAAFDIDQLFGSDKPVVYVADNDTAGKKAASDKQAKCNRLRICYPPVPYKDLTDQLLDRGFGEGEIVQLLASSKAKGIAGRRRKTESVELEESHEVEAESVDLATAREILGQEADATYNHKNKARSIILQVAAAPGTGKVTLLITGLPKMPSFSIRIRPGLGSGTTSSPIRIAIRIGGSKSKAVFRPKMRTVNRSISIHPGPLRQATAPPRVARWRPNLAKRVGSASSTNIARILVRLTKNARNPVITLNSKKTAKTATILSSRCSPRSPKAKSSS